MASIHHILTPSRYPDSLNKIGEEEEFPVYFRNFDPSVWSAKFLCFMLALLKCQHCRKYTSKAGIKKIMQGVCRMYTSKAGIRKIRDCAVSTLLKLALGKSGSVL